MYWEELSEVWEVRRQLLQRRDELSEKNLRLVKSIQAGQSEMDALRFTKKEVLRNINSIKSNIDAEKKLRQEDLHIIDRRDAETKKAKNEIKVVHKVISKTSEMIVILISNLQGRGRGKTPEARRPDRKSPGQVQAEQH